MSPADSPSGGPKKFVPLPGRLPTKEEEMAKKDQKEPKDKPKVYVPGHKPRRSADSGFASSSPYSFEERSPDQYSPSPKSIKVRQADTQVYEQVASKPRPTTNYILKDGKLVRVAPRSLDSRFEDEYVPGPPATPKSRNTGYKTKYKAAKETTKALQAVVADTTEIAQHNYVAAKDQEARFQSLEDELRRLRLQAQISEAKAAEADRKRMEAERKLRQSEIEKELEEMRHDRERRAREFERKQNDEIAASISPATRTRRPTLIDQPHLPKRNAIVTTSYGAAALTATAPPTVTNPSRNPFMDPLDEAAADYDRSQAEVQFSTTDSRRRERQRDDRRYK